MADETLTLASAAELLHTTEDTVALAIRDRGLPAAKVGRAWVLVRTDVIEWLREQARSRSDKEGRTGSPGAAKQAARDLAAALAPSTSARHRSLQAPDLPPASYVTVALAASITGYSEQAIMRKIADNVWLEGKVWRKAPDGRVLISLAGYERWVEGR